MASSNRLPEDAVFGTPSERPTVIEWVVGVACVIADPIFTKE